jgi:hypothetical protein
MMRSTTLKNHLLGKALKPAPFLEKVKKNNNLAFSESLDFRSAQIKKEGFRRPRATAYL